MPIPNDGWLESSDVTPMFPTLVWKLQLKAEFHQPMDERIFAALRAQGLPDAATGRAWQSGQNLHQLDEFRDLVACVERGTRSVLRFLRIGYEAFQITGCWANAMERSRRLLQDTPALLSAPISTMLSSCSYPPRCLESRIW